MKQLSLVMTLLYLLGCGGAAEEPIAVSQATATQIIATDLPPTATAPPPATSIPTAEIVVADPPPTETLIVVTNEPTEVVMAPTLVPTEQPVAMFGRTPEGALYMGRADAEITLIDYSDFL